MACLLAQAAACSRPNLAQGAHSVQTSLDDRVGCYVLHHDTWKHETGVCPLT